MIDFLRNGNPFEAPSSNWKDGCMESDGEIIKGQTMWSIYYHVEDHALGVGDPRPHPGRHVAVHASVCGRASPAC